MARRLAVFVLAITFGCGGTFDREPVPPTEADELGRASSGLRAAHVLPRAIFEDGAAFVSLALDAAFFLANTGATSLGGRLKQLGPNRWQYASNEDRWLTVVPLDAPELRLHYRDLQVPLWDNAANALDRDHLVIIDIEVRDQVYLTLSTSRRGTSVQSEARGTYAYEGEAVQVDLAVAGLRRAEVDSTGSSSLVELTTTGTLVGPEYQIDVQESFRAETVVAGRDSASSSVSTLAHVVEVDGQKYRFEEVRIQRNFRDGKPNDEGFWMAGGQIAAGDNVVAAYRLDTEVVDRERGFILVVLETATGALELERWQAY